MRYLRYTVQGLFILFITALIVSILYAGWQIVFAIIAILVIVILFNMLWEWAWGPA